MRNKVVYSIMLAALLLIAQAAVGQVRVYNTGTQDIEISTLGGGPVIIESGKYQDVNFIKAGAPSKIRIISGLGRTRILDRVEVTPTNGELKLYSGMQSPKADIRKKTPVTPTTKSSAPMEASTRGKVYVDLSVRNGTTHRFITVGPVGEPLIGLALAPGMKSGQQHIPTGLYQIAALVDMDPDKQSTGKNFQQAVIKLIVVEGDTSIVVTDKNIDKVAGAITRVKFRSTFDHKIVFVAAGDKLTGKAVRANSFVRGTFKRNTGFNSMSIQYFKDSVKYQADLEFIITDTDKVIHLGESNLRNVQALGSPSQGGYSTF